MDKEQSGNKLDRELLALAGIGQSPLCQLLPPHVIVADTRYSHAKRYSHIDDSLTNRLWQEGLFNEELTTIEKAIKSRRQEFTAGRNCARAALVELGLPATAIRVGEQREPLLPNGALGSITHSQSADQQTHYCAAAIAKPATSTDPDSDDCHKVISLGIDVEAKQALKPEIIKMIASPAEQHTLKALRKTFPHCPWETVLFSAKESFYKAFYPLMHRFLDFLDAEVQIDPISNSAESRAITPTVGRFTIKVLHSLSTTNNSALIPSKTQSKAKPESKAQSKIQPNQPYEGFFTFDNDFIYTAISIPPSSTIPSLTIP